MFKLLVSVSILFVSSCAMFEKRNDGLLDNDINKISLSIEKSIPSGRLAIVDFRDLNGIITHLGRYISERLYVELSNMQDLTVIDRHSIDFVLNEQKLQSSDFFNENTAAKLGGLVGANYLLYGTITELDDFIQAEATIVDVEKGIIVNGISHNITKTREIASLVGTILKTEEQQQKELEAKRAAILKDIENDKNRRLAALLAEEDLKRNELNELEKEIRDKSIVISEWERNRKELKRKDALIDRIYNERDEYDDKLYNIINKLRHGTKAGDLKVILSDFVDCCNWEEGRDFIVGNYYFIFEDDRLNRVVKYGSSTYSGPKVNSCFQARYYGPNLLE